MITATWQIVVDKQPAEVFDYVADLDNEPQWNPDASNVEKKTAGEIGRGTVFEEDFKGVGHYITTIDVYERPAKLRFDARNPRTDALVEFGFTPSGGWTQVECTVQLTMKGFMRLIEPLISPMVRRQIRRSRGPGLKAALAS